MFEWDKSKAEANLLKHGISFELASQVFQDPFAVTFEDPDHSQQEERFITIGQTQDGRILTLSHTDRLGVVRIISARRSTTGEQKEYE